jgi:drug/metabolite transporter (DMT)-like permease
MKKGFIFLSMAAFAWGWPNVLIKLLSADFDPVTQAFYRYLSAGVTVFILCFILDRKKLVVARQNMKMLVAPVIIVTAHQITYVSGVYLTSAVAASLIAKLNAIFIPALSFVILVEERHIVKNSAFLSGTFFALIGVAGVIFGKGYSLDNSVNLGFVELIFSTVLWSVYAVMIKRVVARIDPVAITAMVPLMSCVLFLPIVALCGNFHRIVEVSMTSRLLLIVSGLLSIGVGNVFYYSALKYIGPSIAASFLLVTPMLTGVLSFFILGEKLTGIQLVFSAVLLFGCFLITKVKRKA